MQQYFVQARLQLGQPLLLDAGQSHHIGSGFHCFETEEAQLFGTDGTVRF